MFNTNVKAVLLYGAETWWITVTTTKRVETFVNSCLRRIVGFWWPEIISNERLWQRTCQIPVEPEIPQRRWRWIGHTLREPCSRQHNTTIQRGRKIDRPRSTCRRDLEADVKETGYTWRPLDKLAQDRSAWPGGVMLAANTSRRSDEDFND